VLEQWRRVEQRATVTDSVPPRFAGKMVGSAQLLLLFSAGGANHCHLQKRNTKRNNNPILFCSVFRSVSSGQFSSTLGL